MKVINKSAKRQRDFKKWKKNRGAIINKNPCKKGEFKTIHQAEEIVKNLFINSKKHHEPYKCIKCKKYHLTTITDKKEIKKFVADMEIKIKLDKEEELERMYL